MGFAPDGTPVGGVLLGPAWSEGRLAPLADALHRRFADTVGATGQALPPPLAPDALAAEETALFCIGAHMSGLPLNGQITSLGGRFVREARTSPDYRLFALGARPGMVRAADGAAIAGEVWALPATAIGALLAQVPPPLGFGTVTLEDGPCLGFLAESAGLAGAAEITHLGGWRAWLRVGGLSMDDAALDAWIDAGTAALGIAVKPEWRQAIRMHLRDLARPCGDRAGGGVVRPPRSRAGVPRMNPFATASEIAAAVSGRARSARPR